MSRKKWNFLIVLVIGILLLLGFWQVWRDEEPEQNKYPLNGQESPLLQFIVQHMMGDHGGIYTNLRDDLPLLKDMATNHHILSESVGLMMIYALRTDNEPLFKTQYQFLRKYLVSSDHFIAWVYDEKGSFGEVAVNASIDDLKIIAALYEASEQWEEGDYAKLADQLSDQAKYNVQNQLLFDYYDWNHDYVAEHITSSYLDLASLRKLAIYDDSWTPVYEKSKSLLLSAQTELGLYYKTWSYTSRTWETPDRFNMIDVLYAAVHLAEDGHSDAASVTAKFIQSKWQEDGQIYASYSLEGEPVDLFHSPAVYALAYRLLAILGKNIELANQIYDAMMTFAVDDQESPYYGGFVELATLEAYSFDHLQALLAETERIRE